MAAKLGGCSDCFFIRMRRDVRHAKIINDAPPPPFSRIIFVLPPNPGERDGSKCERRICAEEETGTIRATPPAPDETAILSG